MTKRFMDIVGAIVGLVVSSPVLLAVAIAVKLDSAGPVLFTQLRVGRGGRLFRLYKFRSMVAQADKGAPITSDADPRITRIGRIIRPLRLDELPQLINVLTGDMSLVGPRPEAPEIVERYWDDQRKVLNVRPGITGPTQLASLEEASKLPSHGEATEYYVRHLLPQKLETDLQYIRTQTLAGDIRILLKTPIRLAQVVLARPRLGPVLKASRLLTDCALVGAATYAAFIARFDGQLPDSDRQVLYVGLPLVLLAYAAPFLYLRTYRSIWRYVGVADFWQVAKACAVGAGTTAIVMLMIRLPYPRSVLVLTPAIALLFLGGARLTWRSAATALAGGDSMVERRRVVIVGAGRTGASVARELLGTPGLAYDVVGFVDDDRRLHRAMLHNLPVLGGTEDLRELRERYQFTEAIIAISRPTIHQLRRIREACTQAGLVFKTLPSLGQLVSGEGQVRYLRQVDVTELLQRDAMSLQVDKVGSFLRGKRIMVTGAGGSIGSELCRQLVRLGVDSLLMVERAENALFALSAELQGIRSQTRVTAALADVKHVPRMKELFANFRPQVVFHAAAYKHVPMLEAQPTEAVLNNVIGTVRLANLAIAQSVEDFVFISTDKAVRPSNLMGATKRICEQYLIALEAANQEQPATRPVPRFRIVRFGNVLGSAGSALPLFQRQIESGRPITITDPDVSRFFMTIEEAVGLVLESTTLDTRGAIAVLDMGEPIKITTLADDLITALGLPASAVPRQFIGLRPGEKLHEALWEELDEVMPSMHPRIAVVRPNGKALKDLIGVVRQLEQLAVEGLVAPMLARVHELVPSYAGGLGNGDSPAHLNGEARKPLTNAAVHRGATEIRAGLPPLEKGA